VQLLTEAGTRRLDFQYRTGIRILRHSCGLSW
jgi:hypothetical protein